MEKQLDLHTIYVRTTKGLLPYMGGANFLDGMRACNNCGGIMKRVPLKQPFIRLTKGKILVDNTPAGYMMLNKSDVDWSWSCTCCNLDIRQKKPA